MELLNNFDQKLLSKLQDSLMEERGHLLIAATGYLTLDHGLLRDLGCCFSEWLKRDSARRILIFMGDWREKDQSEESIKKHIQGVAGLMAFNEHMRARLTVVFVPSLHAKFFSMWGRSDKNEICLEWVTIGSSNFTSAALKLSNVELDIYLSRKDSVPLTTLEQDLANFIQNLYQEQTDDVLIEDHLQQKLNELLDRQENNLYTARQIEADAMRRAIIESDRAQDIGNT